MGLAMTNRCNRKTTRAITLTEDEALALLEICFHTKAEDDAIKVQVMDKVGDLCREFIKSNREEAEVRRFRVERFSRTGQAILIEPVGIREGVCA